MASDESRRKLEVVDPPQNADKLRISVCELLECPVCFNTMYPPIFQCFSGHPLCSSCKPKILDDRCPTCRQELGNIRCLTLEKVTEFLEFPCKYKKYGCSDVYPYHNKLKHESQCSFGHYNCPSGPNCSVRGDIPFLVNHLKDCHRAFVYNANIINQSFENSNPHVIMSTWWEPMVYGYLGQFFYMHFEKFQLGVAWSYIAFLRLMGDEEEAKTYRYSLECGDDERKTLWQGVPRSIRENHREARDSLDGFIIQRNLFIGGDKKELEVTLKIWKMK